MQTETILQRLSDRLGTALRKGSAWSAPDLSCAGQALLALAVRRVLQRAIVIVTDGLESLDTLYRDVRSLASDLAAAEGPLIYFPPPESPADEDVEPDADITGDRLAALMRLAGLSGAEAGRPFVVATCIQAMMHRTMPPDELHARSVILEVGAGPGRQALIDSLTACGYGFTPQIEQKGQASVKGGLVDVWPLTEAWPLRIELLGDTIESIRRFNPADQRSIEALTRATLSSATERVSQTLKGSVLDYLPETTVFLHSDPEAIREHAALYEELAEETDAVAGTLTFSALAKCLKRRKASGHVTVGGAPNDETTPLPVDLQPVHGVFRMPRDTFEPDLVEQARQALLADLVARAADGQTVELWFETSGSLEHFRDQSRGAPSDTARALQAVSMSAGSLSEGVVSETLGFVIVAEADLYGKHRTRSWAEERRMDGPAAAHGGEHVINLGDMEPGDLVVHVEHGVGRYLGLNEIRVSGQLQEVLTIEYADKARLHVPVSQAHLLTRYVGICRRNAKLHRLGGRRWKRETHQARESILDMAASLLETQAERDVQEGHAFPGDTPWQHDFEASFPYVETPDQHRVIQSVKGDQESRRPMDRLVCGDAGYGKTEVAMRAAFKVVEDNRQVAVLVPTTVLCQQHYDTFCERMAAFPFRIQMLSRFCTPRQRRRILDELAKGTVDVVIGTHAILQPGIRFQDLGLVIVDEEQRFGVEHKERLKTLRRMVDVLTLTATPIPRTLYMSMTGARDMSLIQSPPRERLAIETIVARNDDKVIREALLREINREGQVYYLHNRVMSIDLVRQRLERLVPEARIAVAHGQMPSSQLAKVMHAFVAGDFDVLLCTTIIESGMDIPRANTILIDRADRFGIADLYQLRGRVGRSSRKAYAYLLLPARGSVDSDARKRIRAVRKYSTLSAGFKLALRDLEIRGAGNLLGPEQSGHITAIGFGLYCQLLKSTIARLKGDVPPPVVSVDIRLDFISLSPDITDPGRSAVIPYEYVEDESLRIRLYRKLAEAASHADVESLREEIRDRFGPMPIPVLTLLGLAELRAAAHTKRIQRVEVREGKVMLMRNGEFLKTGSRFPRLADSPPGEQLRELIEIVKENEG